MKFFINARVWVALLILVSPISCAKKSAPSTLRNETQAVESGNNPPSSNNSCVNINTADETELMILPGIGPGFAKKIIDYRQKHGRFRRPQDLIIISGFGEKKYHKLESFVCAN